MANSKVSVPAHAPSIGRMSDKKPAGMPGSKGQGQAVSTVASAKPVSGEKAKGGFSKGGIKPGKV